jgi:hypothetical protein
MKCFKIQPKLLNILRSKSIILIKPHQYRSDDSAVGCAVKKGQFDQGSNSCSAIFFVKKHCSKVAEKWRSFLLLCEFDSYVPDTASRTMKRTLNESLIMYFKLKNSAISFRGQPPPTPPPPNSHYFMSLEFH